MNLSIPNVIEFSVFRYREYFVNVLEWICDFDLSLFNSNSQIRMLIWSDSVIPTLDYIKKNHNQSKLDDYKYMAYYAVKYNSPAMSSSFEDEALAILKSNYRIRDIDLQEDREAIIRVITNAKINNQGIISNEVKIATTLWLLLKSSLESTNSDFYGFPMECMINIFKKCFCRQPKHQYEHFFNNMPAVLAEKKEVSCRLF